MLGMPQCSILCSGTATDGVTVSYTPSFTYPHRKKSLDFDIGHFDIGTDDTNGLLGMKISIPFRLSYLKHQMVCYCETFTVASENY